MFPDVPVIVIGADTGRGRAILDGLYTPAREIRAFVSDEAVGAALKERGIKVALGDVSDESHVEAASLRCFSAVLVADAARDDRERSFARTPEEVMSGWARAIAGSMVTRAIWVMDEQPPATSTPESAWVIPDDPELVSKVVALDDAQEIPSDGLSGPI